MGDPLRENSCELPDCAELNNSFCRYENDSGSGPPICENMATNISNWSDVVAFIYFGIEFRLGIPFRVTENRTTGGWVGPLNIILAKNFTTEEEEVNSHVIDRYETRYIQTPMSPFIMMSPNMTLLAPEDFQNYFGPKAISSTAQVQAETIDDFYAPFFETCDNGNVHPILPLYQFEFVRDPQTGNETIDVRLDYKILTIPDENTHAWKWMPTLSKRGLPVKGPYCYADKLRGWVIDLPYDSKIGSEYINLEHGCVKGLPCLPLAGQLLKPEVKVEVHETPGPTTVDFRSVAYLLSLVICFAVAFFASLVVNYRLRKRLLLSSPSDSKRSSHASRVSIDEILINGRKNDAEFHSTNTAEELIPTSTEEILDLLN